MSPFSSLSAAEEAAAAQSQKAWTEAVASAHRAPEVDRFDSWREVDEVERERGFFFSRLLLSLSHRRKLIYRNSPSIHRRPLTIPLRRHSPARLLAVILLRRHLPRSSSVPGRACVIASAGGGRVLLRPRGVLGCLRCSRVAVSEASLCWPRAGRVSRGRGRGGRAACGEGEGVFVEERSKLLGGEEKKRDSGHPESRNQARVISICASDRGCDKLICHALGDSAEQKSAWIWGKHSAQPVVSPINIRLARKDGDEIGSLFAPCTRLRALLLSLSLSLARSFDAPG